MASVAGLWQFFLQRISGLIILFYVLCVGSELLRSDLTYMSWMSFSSNLIMQVFSVVAWLSLFVHAWIGFKSVLDDYVTSYLMGSKAAVIRSLLISVFWAAIVVALIVIIDFLRLINAAI